MVTLSGGVPVHGGNTAPPPSVDRRPVSSHWYHPIVGLALLLLALTGAAKGFWMLWGPAVNAIPASALGAEGRVGPYRFEAGSQSPDRTPLRGPRLALVGVILPGYALISMDGRPQKAFAAGQEIVAGLALRVIYRDRVLIERGGVPEVLVLQDAKGGPSPLLAAGAPPGGRMIPVPPSSAYPEVQEIGKNQYRVARDQVNAQMRNPDFLTDARLDPYPGGGFVVNGIRPDSVYEKLGLQAGDIIRTVNGASVNSVADAVRFYQQLYQTNQVRLGVVRGGRVVQLSYNLH